MRGIKAVPGVDGRLAVVAGQADRTIPHRRGCTWQKAAVDPIRRLIAQLALLLPPVLEPDLDLPNLYAHLGCQHICKTMRVGRRVIILHPGSRALTFLI